MIRRRHHARITAAIMAAVTASPVLMLAGCTLGPNYHLPARSVAAAPAAQAPFIGAPDAAPLPPRWWHLYNDPVLDGLEEQALAANADLRVAGANLARAQAMTAVADGATEPELGLSGEAARSRLSGESYLLTEPLPVATLGTVSMGLSYQLDLFGRIRRATEAARADEAAVAATRDAVAVTVAAEVARAYMGVCTAGEDHELADAAVAVQAHTLDAISRLATAGRLAAPDVTQARARLAQTQALIPQIAARRRAALYRLAALLGRPPAAWPREADACHAIPAITGPLPVGDGAALIRRRPDIRAAERQLAAATARVGVAMADMYPSISLGANLGSSGFLQDMGKAAANTWSVGPMIQWAFPTKGPRARVRAANASADAALARFDAVVLEALRETETSLSACQHDGDKARALGIARQEADTAKAEADAMRRAGRAPLLTGLASRSQVISARAAEAAAHAETANDQINLFLALGGGW